MFYIPDTLEGIKAKLDEINNHVTDAKDPNMVHHFYAQALVEAYYTFEADEKAVS